MCMSHTRKHENITANTITSHETTKRIRTSKSDKNRNMESLLNKQGNHQQIHRIPKQHIKEKRRHNHQKM